MNEKKWLILPVHNRVDETLLFLKSLGDHVACKLNIIIVDDQSSDDYSLLNGININKHMVSVFRTAKEEWWGGSVNFGINILTNLGARDTDIVIFANNDVTVDKSINNVIMDHRIANGEMLLHPVTRNNETMDFVSSGAKVKSWIPYYTEHIFEVQKETFCDFLTARFLVVRKDKITKIPKKIPQYYGDYFISYIAKRGGCVLAVTPTSEVYLNDSETGIKDHNANEFKIFISSLYSMKSPNNMRHKMAFFVSLKGRSLGWLIAINSILNSFLKFLLYKNFK